jgi:hypothetical protein
LLETYTLREGILTWLAADNPEEARDGAAALLAQQTAGSTAWPVGTYRIQHTYVFVARAQTELYRGRPAAAWDAIVAEWPDLKRSFVLSLKLFRGHLYFMRARAAIALDLTRPSKPSADELLGDAKRMRNLLARDALRAAPAWSALVSAGLASASNDRAGAIALLRDAVAKCEQAEMGVYADVARFALGALIAAEEGPSLRESASENLRRRGVIDVERFTQTLCPGIDLS